MLAALVIVFREVIEAGLIVGIVMAATRGVPTRGRWIAYGVGAGVAGAMLLAAFAGIIADTFEGTGQELLNAGVLSLAVAMLTWHNVWMARHGREMAQEMQQVGSAVSTGERPLTALAIVVGLAVLREGSEVVLFLYGVLAGGNSAASVFAGGIAGLGVGVVFTILTYAGLLTIPSRYIFQVTSVLIALLAAGLAAQAVQFLDQAGAVTALETTLWDTSAWLSEGSIVGKLLHTLIGYTERPSEMQLVVYLAVLAVMAVLMWTLKPPPKPAMATSRA